MNSSDVHSRHVPVICLLAVLHWAPHGILPSGHRRVQQPNESTSLSVKVSALEGTVPSGQDPQLRVEIWNEGAGDVFVCKDFERVSWPYCSLTLYVEDASGRRAGPQGGIAADFYHASKQTLSEILLRDWVALRPGHFYGTTVTLHTDVYPQLRKPGVYRISAEYTSAGLLAGYQGSVASEPGDIARLPATAWEGTVQSAAVVIHVVRRNR